MSTEKGALPPPMGPREMRNWANNLIEFPDFRHTPAVIRHFGRSVLALLDQQQPSDGGRDHK